MMVLAHHSESRYDIKKSPYFQSYTFPSGTSRSQLEIWYSYILGSWQSVTVSGSLSGYTLTSLLTERQYNISVRASMRYSGCYTNIYGAFSSQISAITMETGKQITSRFFLLNHILSFNWDSLSLWGVVTLNFLFHNCC